MMQPYPLPNVKKLPKSMPNDGSISMILEEGVPVFRASSQVQERIQKLLTHQLENELTSEEVEELDRYEEIDDYLSHLNRVVRNLVKSQK
ncbi:MAG: hypothetical protein H6652_16810 [Ardenticatenaceae bacterium]|nr:hypothetical protein [Ardenticatenaceae bacterium]MCB8948823.1 hypothetical protein [Ardenticatenaceae bacterium]